MIGVIYTRVSTKEQADNRTSLDTQERECLQHALKLGFQVPEENIYREKGESAKVIDRTELQRLLKYVRESRGSIDTLFIWKIDRLARNLGDYYGIKVALNKYGVKIISVTEPMDDDPVGRFLEAILAAAAQFDNEIRAIRTVTGMRARVEQGGWPHSAPVGYKKIDGRVVIDEVTGPAIREVLLEFSKQKYNLTNIAKFAETKGITTKNGKQKTTDAMRIILQNPFYAGLTRNKLTSGLNQGLHEPLVAESIIQKNIEIINDSTKSITFSGDDLYPLRRFLICTNCSKNMTGSTSKGNGGFYSRYFCNSKGCRTKITGKPNGKNVNEVHADFRKILEDLKPLDEYAKVFKNIVLRKWNEEYENEILMGKKINRELESYQALRAKTIEKYIEDKLTDSEKDTQLKTLDTKISGLIAGKQRLEMTLENREEIIDQAMTFLSDPEKFWSEADTATKQAIQKLLFPKGLPYDFETGFGTIENINSYLLIRKIASGEAINSNLVAPTGLEPVTLGL